VDKLFSIRKEEEASELEIIIISIYQQTMVMVIIGKLI
jgi:hypothetical protein